jgi:glycine betaine/choline ABC-type transport system substrate-binding protein
VPVARSATLLRHPEVREALEALAGRITIEDMRRLNQAVDAGRRDPAVVAGEFLAQLEQRRPSKG